MRLSVPQRIWGEWKKKNMIQPQSCGICGGNSRICGGITNVLEDVSIETKRKAVEIWRGMSEGDKTHFINQVAIVLSTWGSDDDGKSMVVEVLDAMISDGSSNLVDFSLYLEKLLNSSHAGNEKTRQKIKRAIRILEDYRIRNALPGEAHREIV